MRIFITPEFFSLCETIYNDKQASMSDISWLIKIRAFASKHRYLTEKQLQIMIRIGEKSEIDFTSGVRIESFNDSKELH